MKPFVPLASVALTGIACAESGDPASVPAEGLALDFENWGSAGVHIVANTRPPADSRLGWRVGEQPALLIVRGLRTGWDGEIWCGAKGRNRVTTPARSMS